VRPCCWPASVAIAWLACAVVAIGQGIGQEMDQLEPAAAEELLDALKGAVIRMRRGGEGKSRTRDGITLIGDVQGAAQLQQDLSAYLGKPLTTLTFPAVAETIVRHFETHDRPVVEVTFPEQDITDGVLRIDVEEGRFGELKVTPGGAPWNGERLTRQLHLPEIVSQSAILQELDWLNENRLRKATVTVAEGDGGTADIQFHLVGDRTWRAFSGYENSGVDLLGEHRFFTGLELGNLFNCGHQLSYQYFTDDSLDRFRAHALVYRLPLPRLHHVVSMTAAIVDSDVELADVGGLQKSNGTSWLAAVSYKIPLQRSRNLKHSAAAGLEFKSSNNNFEFGGGNALDTPTEVIQAGIAYDADIQSPFGGITLDLDLKWSPGEMSDRNSDEAFAMLRPGAESGYFCGRAAIETSHALGAGFDMNLRARGQWSGGTPLIPSEQLALGGYDSARGYAELESLGDSGFLVSAEIYTPTLEAQSTRLRWLAFLDYGVAFNEVEKESDELASYGVGLRFQVSERAAVRFDYGWQFETGESRAHAGVAVEF
jgi:hemolysin activation/secretion protein